MYLDSCKVRVKDKVYSRVLLRESYRQDGKVKHRTIANLSKCSTEEIAAIKFALRHKHQLEDFALTMAATPATGHTHALRQGLSVGAVAVLDGLAKQLGIVKALGEDRQGKLALWQVMARVIEQGSRLSAVRLAGSHACCELLGLDAFNEDHLYTNLAWLSRHQAAIEASLFDAAFPQHKPPLFLYDVTSSYLEGKHNAFGAFGFNRDGKRGKQQIVIGLLCDGQGRPLSIEVYAGNMLDPKTMSSQIQKVVTRFGGGCVTFVGDRGMIKSAQIAELADEGFHYITAITKPQIESLLKTGVLQMELFDQPLAEISATDGVRYVLRRNPRRAEEMCATRRSKLDALEKEVEARNLYLAEHPRAKVATAIKAVESRITKLKLCTWIRADQVADRRQIELIIDEDQLAQASKLDGCYVIKTDLSAVQADKETVHDRYKDLALVEQAFRTSKTVELEMRPVHVRLECSTRGHALVVMLAYLLVQELARCWSELDLTVGEGIRQLATLCTTDILSAGEVRCGCVPQPRPEIARLIELTGVELPAFITPRRAKVATKTKLPKSRVKRS